MARPNVILVPTDFDEAAELAAAKARELAPALDAELCLLHVRRLVVPTHPEVAMAEIVGLQAAGAAEAKTQLDREAARFGAGTTIVREGDPATELLSAIDELCPTLVVMTTHGRHGLGKLVLGSVADRVVRESSVPVLMIGPRAAAKAKAA